MKIYFEKIKLTEKIKGICLKCGKKATKTIVSEQTINPYNKNKKGSIKTRDEVIKSVKNDLPILVNRWKEKFICNSCDNNRRLGEKWFDKTEYETLHEEELDDIYSELRGLLKEHPKFPYMWDTNEELKKWLKVNNQL